MQRELFDLSSIPAHKAAATEDAPPERRHTDLSPFQTSVLERCATWSPSFRHIQDMAHYYRLSDWWELILAGYIYVNEAKEGEITQLGIDYLTERGLL